MARVVLEARKQSPDITMEDLLKPSNFDLVVNSTKNITMNKDLKDAPLTMARKIGLLLVHLCNTKLMWALRYDVPDEAAVQDVNNFRIKHKCTWNKL